MGVLTPRGTSHVAVSEGRVVGFIRIVEAGGDRYVNPIVVAASAQRRGIGRALMEEARTRYGALLFVARGSAVPFYTALGCERVGRGAHLSRPRRGLRYVPRPRHLLARSHDLPVALREGTSLPKRSDTPLPKRPRKRLSEGSSPPEQDRQGQRTSETMPA